MDELSQAFGGGTVAAVFLIVMFVAWMIYKKSLDNVGKQADKMMDHNPVGGLVYGCGAGSVIAGIFLFLAFLAIVFVNS